MPDTKPENPPAFPCNWHDFQPATGEQVIREQYFGLTMRDYFAIRATEKDIEMWQCILAQNGIPTSREEAKFAYADAMLRARNGGAS